MRTSFRAWMIVLAVLAGCSSDDNLDRPVFERPETAVRYDVALDGMPNDEMTALAEDSLAVFRRQEDGAQSLAFLRRRAEGDVDLIQRILRSRGYYRGEVEVTVTALDEAAPEDEQRAEVSITVDPGPPFTLIRHGFVVAGAPDLVASLDAGDLGSPVGAPAAAEQIVGAEAAALDRLQRTGYPYATQGRRRAVADLEQATLEIDTPLTAGPSAVFGPVSFEGLEDVRARYLRTYIPWSDGETFDLRKLRTYQQALLGTDLFETVSVTPPETAPDGPEPVALPVAVTAQERPFRTVSAGGRFSTDEGPSLQAGFEHRNLFGENETLTVEAELGVQVQTFGLGYREPQYQRPGQDLLASLTFKREEDDAFDDLTVTGRLGLERALTPRWTVGAGGLAEASLISDEGEDTSAFLLGLPATVAYDGSDDPLNPSRGGRWRLEFTPYAGIFDDAFAGFVSMDTTGSAYLDLTGQKDYILAARGRLGSIVASDLDDVPPTRRLYAGGGGSVRGFAQRFVGPLDDQNDPIGGLSALELGLEMRARLYQDFGGVIFAEAGSVSTESWPDFEEGVQVAAGLGFRYFSPAGPIRVDLALPLNGRDADDAFQVYFSIGQAF